jgi:phosphonate transport system permease protein
MTATLTPDLTRSVTAAFSRKRWVSFAIPGMILIYLAYIFVAFDILGLADRARMDNARILMSDFVSYKTHVARDNRTGDVTVAIEGENKGTYPADMLPDWVSQTNGRTIIDLGDNNIITYMGDVMTYALPGYGTIDVRPGPGGLALTTPDGEIPAWINASNTRITITAPAGRVTYTRSRIETFKYAAGWELFFFTLDSPFYGKSPLTLAGMALIGDRVDPARANIVGMAQDFWTNRMWRHGDVVWAIFETILMAFLGTFGAAIIALPLGFVAASNFMPVRIVRAAMRRVFDFVRGVDGLIWTIILSRAFGPGPMTGALAILLTDTGSFGKLFSEALENIDEKQVEGVRSTGANAVLRARFGVIPQVTPVLLSQILYHLESNTRSATVIGAIVGGGIGLLLTQAIQTQKDWEEVAYYVTLIILMVMAMDTLSGWLRRKLIKGE